MKKIPVFAITLLICVTALAAVPVMTKPVTTTFTVPHYTSQLQWRAANGPFGTWTFATGSYADSDDYTLAGNKLNTTITFSPLVTNLKGGDTQYKFDKKSGFWIQDKTLVSYNYAPLYGDYMVTNHFEGYLAFYNGMPSSTTFVHGVMYQWIYIHAPKGDTGVTTLLPNAHWDEDAHAWLVGFSIYLYDHSSTDYSWVTFPDPFQSFKPEDIYNPLSL